MNSVLTTSCHRARLFCFALLTTLAVSLALSARAAGPLAADTGWTIDNSGNLLLTATKCSQLVANGVGWQRIGMRLIPGHTNMDSTMLGYYDNVINTARAAGIQVLILVNNESYSGSQSAWDANNNENTGGNGDNSYIDGWIANSFVPVVQHFHDRVKVYEIWNEPSTWSSHSGNTYSGASFMYPSCYSWLLTKSWQQVHKVLNYSDCKVVSGGIFGTTDLANTDPVQPERLRGLPF